MTNLDCKIYVDASISRSQLIETIAKLLDGLAEKNTLRVPDFEIDVLENDEFDEFRRREFPDGFLYFHYIFEIYANTDRQIQDRAALVSKILEHLWSEGFPAVAACDYETELPESGGYKNRSAPWPER